jgi:hypothetical protein
MLKSPPAWETLRSSRENVAITLLTNIKAIKGLLETDAFNEFRGTEVYEKATVSFTTLNTDYTARLQTLATQHAAFTGPVTIEDTHKYMYFAQQYSTLLTDITSTAVGFAKILVNLKEKHSPMIKEPTDGQS